MPSNRRQKAKARKTRKRDIFSDYGNMDVMLGDGNSKSIERELDNVINCPDGHQDFESFPNRGSSSQEMRSGTSELEYAPFSKWSHRVH